MRSPWTGFALWPKPKEIAGDRRDGDCDKRDDHGRDAQVMEFRGESSERNKAYHREANAFPVGELVACCEVESEHRPAYSHDRPMNAAELDGRSYSLVEFYRSSHIRDVDFQHERHLCRYACGRTNDVVSMVVDVDVAAHAFPVQSAQATP